MPDNTQPNVKIAHMFVYDIVSLIPVMDLLSVVSLLEVT